LLIDYDPKLIYNTKSAYTKQADMAKKSVNWGNIAVKIPAGFGLSVNIAPRPLQRRWSYCRVVNEAAFQSPLL
jgi:hypothetical protein